MSKKINIEAINKFVADNDDIKVVLSILNGNDNDITPSKFANALRLLADVVDYININVDEYNELWPKKLLPTNHYARSNKKDVERAFKSFYKNYNYDWKTVLKATKRYVERKQLANWEFCKTSAYFVMKNGMSDLATECEVVINGEDREEKFKTRVV